MPAPVVLSGRYELGDLIGRGGMADVYEGLDLRLGRRVAVKMLRPDMARESLALPVLHSGKPLDVDGAKDDDPIIRVFV